MILRDRKRGRFIYGVFFGAGSTITKVNIVPH